MGVRREYQRHSAVVRARAQWKRVRWEALRRDGFQCVRCGARGRLEVDHIVPVRDAPLEAYSLANLQTLCKPCHSVKTKQEVGFVPPPLPPERQAWRDLLKETPSCSRV